MIQFSEWFISSFKIFWKNVGLAFKEFFVAIYNLLIGNMVKYIQQFAYSSNTFTAGDWAGGIFAIVIAIVLHIALLVLLFLLLRRYIRFCKKQHEKENLMHEVAKLNHEVTSLQDEKNAVLALSGDVSPSNENGKRNSLKKNKKDRFVKLNNVDVKYDFEVMPCEMIDKDKLNLEELVDTFINFSASKLHLYYDKKTISTYFAGMASSKTMILEGISGTGKTSLPYAMGKFFNNDSNIISVQPSWRDRAEMMGYLNDFTKKFNETEFLKAVYESTYRSDINFVVLDEMNLARVEYYFADFLSLLEMPNPEEWLIELVPDQLASDPFHLKEGKLQVPENVWFVGTANKDDSTFTITDKVYDRAMSIVMNNKAEKIDAEPTEKINMSFDYLNKLFIDANEKYQISEKSFENLQLLDKYITENFEITFGNRIMKQIHKFMSVYMACGGDEIEGLDYLVSRKIIRKFETLNLPFMQQELADLTALIDKLFGKNNFNECRGMLKGYTKQF